MEYCLYSLRRKLGNFSLSQMCFVKRNNKNKNAPIIDNIADIGQVLNRMTHLMNLLQETSLLWTDHLLRNMLQHSERGYCCSTKLHHLGYITRGMLITDTVSTRRRFLPAVDMFIDDWSSDTYGPPEWRGLLGRSPADSQPSHLLQLLPSLCHFPRHWWSLALDLDQSPYLMDPSGTYDISRTVTAV